MAGAYEFYITDGEYMAFIGDGEDFGSDKKYAYSIGSPEDQVWDAESDDFKTAVKELVKAVSKYKKKMLETLKKFGKIQLVIWITFLLK